jgi:hypothetical protein
MLRVGSHRASVFLETMSLSPRMVSRMRVYHSLFSWVVLRPTFARVTSLEVLLILVWSSNGQIRGGLLPDPKLRTSGYEKRVR